MATNRSKVAARERARQRRLELDAERRRHDERVEAVVGDYIGLEDQRQQLREKIAAIEVQMDEPIRDLLALGQSSRRIEALLELSPDEARAIRRLRAERRSRDAVAARPAIGLGVGDRERG